MHTWAVDGDKEEIIHWELTKHTLSVQQLRYSIGMTVDSHSKYSLIWIYQMSALTWIFQEPYQNRLSKLWSTVRLPLISKIRTPRSSINQRQNFRMFNWNFMQNKTSGVSIKSVQNRGTLEVAGTHYLIFNIEQWLMTVKLLS